MLFTGLLLAFGFSQSALATNGYSPTGFGTINKGLAGAGVAFPQDSMSTATNPAGLALVCNRWDVGAALFRPSDRGFTADNNGTPPFQVASGQYTSKIYLFLVPHIGLNKLLTNTSILGVSKQLFTTS